VGLDGVGLAHSRASPRVTRACVYGAPQPGGRAGVSLSPPGPSDPWLYIGGGYHLVSHGNPFKTRTSLSLRIPRL
jgi:hypothetical protein